MLCFNKLKEVRTKNWSIGEILNEKLVTGNKAGLRKEIQVQMMNTFQK